MVGLGTVINVILIIVGGFVGLFLKNFLKESLQKSLMQAMGVAVLFISISGVLEKMMLVEKSHLISNHTNMMIITLALGTVLGELLSLDSYIDKFGTILSKKQEVVTILNLWRHSSPQLVPFVLEQWPLLVAFKMV